MFPKENKLIKRKDILFTMKAKFRFFHQLFQLKMQPVKSQFETKFLIIIPKKVLKSAVKRRRVARKIYAIFHILDYKNQFSGAFYTIQITNSKILNLSHDSLIKELDPVFKQLYKKNKKTQT
jgi:ribonuclease P protein component